MNRRNFLALLGGASILSTPVATAQPTERTCRVGALVLSADNATGQAARDGLSRDCSTAWGVTPRHFSAKVFRVLATP